jgi:hypothetical protein
MEPERKAKRKNRRRPANRSEHEKKLWLHASASNRPGGFSLLTLGERS